MIGKMAIATQGNLTDSTASKSETNRILLVKLRKRQFLHNFLRIIDKLGLAGCWLTVQSKGFIGSGMVESA